MTALQTMWLVAITLNIFVMITEAFRGEVQSAAMHGLVVLICIIHMSRTA